MKSGAAAIFDTYRTPVSWVAIKFNRDESTVRSWINGTNRPPPYLEAAIIAAKSGKKMLTFEQMLNRPLHELNVTPQIIRYWHKTKEYPFAARYAAALLKPYDKPFLPHRQTLRQIDVGRYYQRRGSDTWFVRPVLGKNYPNIQGASMDRLVDNGFVHIEGWRPRLTKKGNERAYGKDN